MPIHINYLEASSNGYPSKSTGIIQRFCSLMNLLGLRPGANREILNVIKELAAEKMTMVIVTHEMSLQEMYGSHYLYGYGVIVEEGPKQSYQNQKMNAPKPF